MTEIVGERSLALTHYSLDRQVVKIQLSCVFTKKNEDGVTLPDLAWTASSFVTG